MAGSRTWVTLPTGERIRRHTPSGERIAVDGGPRCAVTLWGEYRCRRTPHGPLEVHLFDVRPAANDPEVLPTAASLYEIVARRDDAVAELGEVEELLDRLRVRRHALKAMVAAYETLANIDSRVVDGATVAVSNQPAQEAPCEE